MVGINFRKRYIGANRLLTIVADLAEISWEMLLPDYYPDDDMREEIADLNKYVKEIKRNYRNNAYFNTDDLVHIELSFRRIADKLMDELRDRDDNGNLTRECLANYGQGSQSKGLEIPPTPSPKEGYSWMPAK